MAKSVRDRKPTGSKSAAAVVEKETGIKKHKPVLILIAALVLLILIAASLQTEASPAGTGLSIEVSQDGVSLTAASEEPEQTGGWQFVRTGEQVCDTSLFGDGAGTDEPPMLKLTAEDHGKYYCFRAKDASDAYSYQLSEIIDLMSLYEPPAINIRQLGDVLLAETAADDAGAYAWRAVAAGGTECGPQTFANSTAGNLQAGNIFILQAADVGRRYCFESEHPIGFKEYKLSKAIDAFEAAASESLDVAQNGDILIARRPAGAAEWQAASVASEQFCGQRPFGLAAAKTAAGNVTYVKLYADDNGRYYCFQAYVGGVGQPEHVLSPVISGVDDSRPRTGYSRLQADDYPYGVPEAYPTALHLRNTVRSLLTTEGQQVLDGLSIELAEEIDCAAGLSGCYWVGFGHSADGGHNKIFIQAAGQDYYEDFSFRDKAQINHVLLKTLIRELMHAVDLGDGNMAGGHRLRYKANICQETALQAIAERPTDAVDAYAEPIDRIGRLRHSDPALTTYVECLDEQDELFGILRRAYQALPAGDLLAPGGRWSDRGLIMHPAQAGNGNYADIGEPGWYAELYAQLVFERELPQELENHYGAYFSDRQTAAGIFEVNLGQP